MACFKCMQCKHYRHLPYNRWKVKITGECKIRGATQTKTGKPITPVSEADYIAFFLNDAVGRTDNCKTYKQKGRVWGQKLEANIVGEAAAAAD